MSAPRGLRSEGVSAVWSVSTGRSVDSRRCDISSDEQLGHRAESSLDAPAIRYIFSSWSSFILQQTIKKADDT